MKQLRQLRDIPWWVIFGVWLVTMVYAGWYVYHVCPILQCTCACDGDKAQLNVRVLNDAAVR